MDIIELEEILIQTANGGTQKCHEYILKRTDS